MEGQERQLVPSQRLAASCPGRETNRLSLHAALQQSFQQKVPDLTLAGIAGKS